ncbi:FAD-binding oxidoreductase [Salipiger manganoxidans]|uniref:NAD(P)/FAD-dependent oxidoreductase n=1 Tax=Salipiger marinus TaxID=555512 RepID=UPI001E3EC763|nr:FAD-dependent oxidoreductase [Salipiger manganoxidans]MCD1620192.1 FAD-binding oxidoreductase [Salipiger manganoxidans]
MTDQIFRIPPYALTAPCAPQAGPLRGSLRLDVALVGAGFSGCIAALDLSRRGLSVALIEAGEVGQGGSGRNHGQCIPVFGYLDETQLPPAGFALLRDAGRLVFDQIAELGIACDPVQKGWLQAAHSANGLERARATHARYATLGKADAFLDPEEVAALSGVSGTFGGWLHRDGGHLNPLAYVRGLARAAQAAGARLHTRTLVTGLRRGRDGAWILATPEGEITARKVGLATNAYGMGAVPARMRASLVPMTSYAIASAPLQPHQRAAVLPSGVNFSDTRRDPMFFRVDATGRIITGGLVELRRGRWTAPTVAEQGARLARRFPELQGLVWTHHWTGTVGISARQRPAIFELEEGLWGLLGYSGRGVPTSAVLGRAFAATLTDPAEGAQLWPADPPARIPAGRLIGLAVQSLRGPVNKLRDRLS